MAYQKRLTRDNPGLVVIMLDQSSSMENPYGETSKQEAASMAVNQTIQEMAIRSKYKFEVRDYCYVAVIGYGDGVDKIIGGWISEIYKNPMEIRPVTIDGLTDEMRIWVKPKAENGTPMDIAFDTVSSVVSDWLNQYKQSFPPIIINITDGEPNDFAATKAAANELLTLSSNDGNVLLFSVHISNAGGSEIILPTSANALPNEYARFLFEISSPIPERLLKEATNHNLPAQPGAKGFVFKAKYDTLAKFLMFGTTTNIAKD